MTKHDKLTKHDFRVRIIITTHNFKTTLYLEVS